MAVYVDDMHKYPMGQYRNMKMSHLIADTQEELLAMVDKIGVQRKWIQYPRTWKEHFDICGTKRKLAIKAGAIPVTVQELSAAEVFRRTEGKLRFPGKESLYDNLQTCT